MSTFSVFDFQFSIKQMTGKLIIFSAPSGSGKSTFLRCLNRLEEPTSGHIWFDGQDLMDLSVNLNALRQKIGMVFQSYELLSH